MIYSHLTLQASVQVAQKAIPSITLRLGGATIRAPERPRLVICLNGAAREVDNDEATTLEPA